jgi:hypothetical protein
LTVCASAIGVNLAGKSQQPTGGRWRLACADDVDRQQQRILAALKLELPERLSADRLM